jgi:hypothetical protein
MKKLMLIFAFCICIQPLNGCQPAEEDTGSGLRSGETPVRTYLINFIFKFSEFAKICEIADELKEGLPSSQQCFASVQTSICKSALAANENIIDSVQKSESSEDTLSTLKKTGIDALKGAVVECIKGAATEEIKDAAKALALKFGANILPTDPPNPNLKKAIAGWACTGGAKALGNAIANTRTVDFENSCKSVIPGGGSAESSKSRAASCLRSAASVCEIVVNKGTVNLDNFLPSDPTLAAQVSRTLASEVASGACKLGAASTQTACAVINAAAAQIKEAILTGDNDWGNCLGTSQLGACLGTIWGSQGYTNNNGVETSTTKTGTDGKSFEYKGCCMCDIEKYANNTFSRTFLDRNRWIGVIQKGDVASGNCRYQETKGYFESKDDLTADGRQISRRYTSCSKKYVSGNICAPNDSGISRVYNSTSKSYDSIRVVTY